MRILAIGNSFSVDSMSHLWGLIHAAGVDAELGNLYIPGCPLATHWNNIITHDPAYTYYTNCGGQWQTQEAVSIYTAIRQGKWDVITLQQASGCSGQEETYLDLPQIIRFVKEELPQAKLLWNHTWAYQQDSTHVSFPVYGSDQMTMYRAILQALDTQVKPTGAFDGIIPAGTAIQNLRTSYLGDTLTRDGYHLSYGIGRYTAALTWFARLTGKAPDSIDWIPEKHMEFIAPNLPAIRQAVKLALEKPFEISKVDVSAEA